MQTPPHLQDVSMDEMQHISLGSDRRINIEGPAGQQTLLADGSDLQATCEQLKEEIVYLRKKMTEDRQMHFRSLAVIVLLCVLVLFTVFERSPDIAHDTGHSEAPTVKTPTNTNSTKKHRTLLSRIQRLEWKLSETKLERIRIVPSFLFSDKSEIPLNKENLGSFGHRLSRFKKAVLVSNYHSFMKERLDLDNLAADSTDLIMVVRTNKTLITGAYMSFKSSLNRNVQFTTYDCTSKGNGFLFDLNQKKIYPEKPSISTSDEFGSAFESQHCEARSQGYKIAVNKCKTDLSAWNNKYAKTLLIYGGSYTKYQQYLNNYGYSYSGQGPYEHTSSDWKTVAALGVRGHLLEFKTSQSNTRNSVATITSSPSKLFGLTQGLFPLETMEVDDYQVYQLLP